MVRISGKLAWGAATLLASASAWAQQTPGGATGDGPGKSSGATGSATGAGKIGIGAIGPANLPADLRIRLEDAAAAGLTASGAHVVSAADLSRARATAALGSCADPVCERRLAQITDTRYWLRGTCQLDTSTYRLHLELVDAQSGATVTARDDTCDICTEADAADLVNVAASSLKATLTRSQASPPAAAPPTPPTIAVDRNPDGRGAEPTGTERPLWRRTLPWVAFVGAAAAVAGGAYVLSFDGDATGCEPMFECTKFYDTTWQGVPLIGLGVALATTGVILLRVQTGAAQGSQAETRETPGVATASTHLVVSVGRLAIAGRF